MAHTGFGKSLSMVFYVGKVVRILNNPTIVVITDRNDLDDQLFSTFADCKQLLRQTPVQAEDRNKLKNFCTWLLAEWCLQRYRNFSRKAETCMRC